MHARTHAEARAHRAAVAARVAQLSGEFALARPYELELTAKLHIICAVGIFFVSAQTHARTHPSEMAIEMRVRVRAIVQRGGSL